MANPGSIQPPGAAGGAKALSEACSPDDSPLLWHLRAKSGMWSEMLGDCP